MASMDETEPASARPRNGSRTKSASSSKRQTRSVPSGSAVDQGDSSDTETNQAVLRSQSDSHQKPDSDTCDLTHGQKRPKIKLGVEEVNLKKSNSSPDIVKRQSSSKSRQHSNGEPNGLEEVENLKDLKTTQRQDSRNDLNVPPRLLIVSSKIKNNTLMQTALHSNVTFVQYKYESASLDSILGSVSQHLGNKKVESIALMVHCTNSTIYISGKDDKVLTSETVKDSKPLRDFLHALVRGHLNVSQADVRLDFLACSMAHTQDGTVIIQEMEKLLHILVGMSRDVTGSDIQLDKVADDGSRHMHIGELYFKMERLRWNGNQQSLSGFEKIRTVGKGAYGTAVLYRKKDDDSLVILKEINLHDLTASERLMALNEVRVLAMLDHPNIISYYDSFEEDGVVMIEMEYADGGTLAQYLAQQEKPLMEKEILSLFAQIVSAIKFIHEHNILHRDFKTANIFLTKEGRVKVGDFGISKLMSTASQAANTVLGTPYYISPEMCEGKPYNDKSDIWALGCILYEMACLQRTFEGSNLPALVNKIMKGQFAPVKGNYSQEFKNLIMSMLQREPEFRPSAADLWLHKLPELMKKYEEEATTDYEEDFFNSSGNNTSTRKRKTRSVLYYFEMTQMQLTPVPLRSRLKIRDVAVSRGHVIVVTQEQMVYTWGDGSKGQLGHGDLESRNSPELVEALKGKSIIKACCGSGFSIFASDNGIVMTCGDGTYGCLGHGDWCSTSRPRLIEALLSVDVVSIACGPYHVVAVGSEGEVFTWGCGAAGRLGLGTGTEENCCQPMEVSFEEPVCVRDCFCGVDGTMLLTDVGSVLACGNNEYNKLGLNNRVGFLMAMKNIFNKAEVAGVNVFSVVRVLARHPVVFLNMGQNHSAVITETGRVYTFGKNTEGQLGTGNIKQQGGPIGVKVFEQNPALRVQCGEYYTVASTAANELLFWGTRFKKPNKPEDGMDSKKDLRADSASSSQSHSRQLSNASISSVSSVTATEPAAPSTRINPETGEGRVGSDSASSTVRADRQLSTDSVFAAASDAKNSNPPASIANGGFKPMAGRPRTRTLSNSKDKDVKDDTELILQPTPLIRMDSQGSHSQTGETVTLSQFFCHGDNLFIQVETTAPPPKRRSRKKRSSYQRSSKRLSSQSLSMPEGVNGMSASSRDGGDEYSSETSELDTSGSRKHFPGLASRLGRTTDNLNSTTMGSIPAWLQQELANSEEQTDGHEPDDTSDHSDEERGGRALQDSSMSSITINRDLKHGPKLKSQGLETDSTKSVLQKHMPVLVPTHDRNSYRTGSAESGVEVTPVDPLSSSSSSENLGYIHSIDVRNKTLLAGKKLIVAPPAKRVSPTAPLPTKTKAGPTQSQKPLNRIRAQGKTRRSDPKEMTAAGRVMSLNDTKQKQENIDQLQTELLRLRQEKNRTEERLKKVEEEHKNVRESVWKEAERKATDREIQLQEEIKKLREDMSTQSRQLQDNYHVVISLQEQLNKVQTEQARLSARDTPRPDSRQSQRESKICVIQ